MPCLRKARKPGGSFLSIKRPGPCAAAYRLKRSCPSPSLSAFQWRLDPEQYTTLHALRLPSTRLTHSTSSCICARDRARMERWKALPNNVFSPKPQH